ncbi:YcgN family cysteine cluster protein [Moraxella sp. Tifton1]|uniref:YcgN family cysteine cluster protein n=1 Tax=Moraxella oculi TaxID=2940516 RepID=A0ABW8U479_9GAMM|nr:YcgN family cysteine cluster protein [Moraxella sp. Tifton1]MCL1624164.1 YcgN family cysteine cluster protein [Moraxella sp. Tifton1]
MYLDDIDQSKQLRERFWEKYSLDELNSAEWEALCDGCGVCCLVKFLDDEDAKFTEYTDVSCKLLDCNTGHCSDYANRKQHVPDCIRLTADLVAKMMWLPRHCAYKRLHLNQKLPHWHYLIAGRHRHDQQMKKLGVQGRCISEVFLDEEQIEERVIRWVKI